MMRFFVFMLFICSCSGYQFHKNSNPFAIDGIRSLSVPLFVNHSNIPGLAGSFTKEVGLLLSRYPGLEIHAGKSESADGVLLGIISSNNLRRETLTPSQFKFITPQGIDSSRERNPFFVPIQVSYRLKLRLVLIKRPNKKDMALLKTGLALHAPFHSKVVFDTTIHLLGSYSQPMDTDTSPDDGGPVNFTKAQGHFHHSIRELAKLAAERFKQEILNVF